MSPKLILHIGHGKTGTSYIQSALALNIHNLEKHGIHYPNNGSFSLAIDARTTSGNGDIIFKPKFKVTGTTLLSDEGFCTNLANEDRFKHFVLRHNCELEVILYTRNVFDMLTSAWGQRIKTGISTLDLDEY